MALVYNFAFPSPAAGETVTVTDDGGTEVGSGDLGSTVGTDGAITLQVSLPEGGYIGTVEGSFGTWTTRGLLDVPDSIEDQPGASETAYLIATGPADVSDGGGAAGTLVFEADAREGELPTWCTIVDGDIHLSADAGTCGFSFNGVYDFDFTATTPQEASGDLTTGFTLKVDGVQKFVDTAGTPGDGLDEQSTDPHLDGGLLGGSVVTCEAYPSAADVLDGVATPDVGFTVTRLTPLAQRPSQ